MMSTLDDRIAALEAEAKHLAKAAETEQQPARRSAVLAMAEEKRRQALALRAGASEGSTS